MVTASVPWSPITLSAASTSALRRTGSIPTFGIPELL
jgi:hypothetical protein